MIKMQHCNICITFTLQAECLETGSLFEDDTFGPEYNEEWKRPQDICDDPCLFDEGSSRFDVVQVSFVYYL